MLHFRLHKVYSMWSDLIDLYLSYIVVFFKCKMTPMKTRPLIHNDYTVTDKKIITHAVLNENEY